MFSVTFAINLIVNRQSLLPIDTYHYAVSEQQNGQYKVSFPTNEKKKLHKTRLTSVKEANFKLKADLYSKPCEKYTVEPFAKRIDDF